MNKTIEEIRNETDANIYIDRAIAMLKEKCEGEYLVAGYNGIVSLLHYAKESHQFQQEQKQGAGVWVRASERLPNWDEDIIRSVINDGGKIVKKLFPIHQIKEVDDHKVYLVNGRYYLLSEIEWLDETHIPEKGSEEGWSGLFHQHIDFCNKVFPSSSEISCLHHAIEEICEIWKENDNEKKPEEYADAFMCLLHGLNKSGISIKDFKGVFEGKLNKNISRTWNKNADGSYSHNKKIK